METDSIKIYNPMESELPMHLSPRCGAKTRRGAPCQSPAMPNGRCRIHGAKSAGAPKRNRNALKHGLYSAAVVANRRKVGALSRASRKLASAQRGADDCCTHDEPGTVQ
jgi:hypothetical protein